MNIVIKNSNNNMLLKKRKKKISGLSQRHFVPEWILTCDLRVSTYLPNMPERSRPSDYLCILMFFNAFSRRFDHKLFFTLYVWYIIADVVANTLLIL